MIWMVHRASLDDPTLLDLNFDNMRMPEPHIESRIVSKLMKAMETNTHIKVLSLKNSNLMKAQGLELGRALAVNTTLRVVHVQHNFLDSPAVAALATDLEKNTDLKLEEFC